MPFLIIVGIVALFIFFCVVYSWYEKAKTADNLKKQLEEAERDFKTEKERLLSKLNNSNIDLIFKNKEIATLNNEIDVLNDEEARLKLLCDEKSILINHGICEASKKLAESMATQHRLVEYYNRDDINAFRKYFNSVALDRYFNKLHDYRLVRAFKQDMEIISAEVSAKVTSASEKNKSYVVTLTSCGCEDFKENEKKNKGTGIIVPCKHMLFLAMQLGVLPYRRDIINSEYQIIVDALEELEGLKKLKKQKEKTKT